MNQSFRMNTSKCNGYESLMATIKKLSKEELDYQKDNNKRINIDYQFNRYNKKKGRN